MHNRLDCWCISLTVTYLRFKEEDQDEPKYQDECLNLPKRERNTLLVDFGDVQTYSQELATVITEEYYRLVYI